MTALATDRRRLRRRGGHIDFVQEIYVGNLPFDVRESTLQQLFAEHGKVISVTIPTYSVTRQPRSFGFVQMPKTDAATAIAALNGADFGGQTLHVRVATAQADDGSRSNGGHEHGSPATAKPAP